MGSPVNALLQPQSDFDGPQPVDSAWLEPTWIVPETEFARLTTPYVDPNDQTQQTPDGLADSGSNSRSIPMPVRMVDAEHPNRQHDPHALLWSRLTAAAWVLLVGLGLFFVYQFATYSLTPGGIEAGVLTVTIGAAVLLTGKRSLDASNLRLLELALFGVVGVQMVSTQLHWLNRAIQQESEMELIWAATGGRIVFVTLMMCYSMYMPNGWRRTAAMLIPPALAPVGILLFTRIWSPFAYHAISPERLGELAATMVGCWSVAVFGTWTIATLRQDFRRALRFGQYRLKQRIGHGGMGEVYLAEHRLLKRPCAVKLIRSTQVNDPSALVRFEREVRSTAQLSHWHTIEIYDYGHTDEGTFYYVMEYLPGLNLSDLVRRFGPLCPERVIHFLIQTCEALEEAHSHGLIHRDLKPANIFASHRGGAYDVTKLLDFGLVCEDARPDMLLEADPKLVGPFAGSPLYMAPEQASGDLPPDPRSDLYSLGATGYFLLTGHPPFEGKTPMRLMLSHARDPVVPPSRWDPNIPEDLEAVILRCLEKHPSRRYPSVRQLREALSRCHIAGKWTAERATQWWRLRAPAIFVANQSAEDFPSQLLSTL